MLLPFYLLAGYFQDVSFLKKKKQTNKQNILRSFFLSKEIMEIILVLVLAFARPCICQRVI